jgi:hypothetical protein
LIEKDQQLKELRKEPEVLARVEQLTFKYIW